ncbi:MAG: hypothetical protein IPH27_05905 [Actinomycetales bacterium]|nr:hypothetical protein [Candidatus Phosphoribacter baldrii]
MAASTEGMSAKPSARHTAVVASCCSVCRALGRGRSGLGFGGLPQCRDHLRVALCHLRLGHFGSRARTPGRMPRDKFPSDLLVARGRRGQLSAHRLGSRGRRMRGCPGLGEDLAPLVQLGEARLHSGNLVGGCPGAVPLPSDRFGGRLQRGEVTDVPIEQRHGGLGVGPSRGELLLQCAGAPVQRQPCLLSGFDVGRRDDIGLGGAVGCSTLPQTGH